MASGEVRRGLAGTIVFHSNRDGDYEIFVMNGDGSGQTQLTLISHRTNVSWPDASFGPYRKSASHMTGSDAVSRPRRSFIPGTHSDSALILSRWY